MIETPEQVKGETIKPGQAFNFACGPGLACFNTCCKNKRLPLWPYDLLRLRKNLKLNSAQILERYAELEMDPASGWPSLRIKLDEKGRCSFLSERGCGVYPDRPAACRIYPLARLAAPGKDGAPPEVIYMRQKTGHCLGWDQDREHTIKSWTVDQGLKPYDAANDQLLKLLFHPGRKGKMDLKPQQVHAVIAALYNLDTFRKMLKTPLVKDLFKPGQIKHARGNDERLMLLGRDFLIKVLFGG
jgi:Fe-S-cluster containining protein